jgi:hypothetical protein
LTQAKKEGDTAFSKGPHTPASEPASGFADAQEEQVPFVHWAPTGQGLPHLPQLFGSLDALTHVSLPWRRHVVVAPVHTHLPLWQPTPASQDVSQLPQLRMS